MILIENALYFRIPNDITENVRSAKDFKLRLHLCIKSAKDVEQNALGKTSSKIVLHTSGLQKTLGKNLAYLSSTPKTLS